MAEWNWKEEMYEEENGMGVHKPFNKNKFCKKNKVNNRYEEHCFIDDVCKYCGRNKNKSLKNIKELL